MNFLAVRRAVDAQLPKLLADWLNANGYDAIHTLELPRANKSDDNEIIDIADKENRIVVSKDGDFLDDHIVRGKPRRLLVVKTGNIKNSDLIRLFELNINDIKKLFDRYVLIEINRVNVIVHA